MDRYKRRKNSFYVHAGGAAGINYTAKPLKERAMQRLSGRLGRNSMDNQLAELCVEPSSEFSNFVRMSCSDFEYLLQKISPMVAKKRYRLEGCNTSEGAPGSNIKIFSYWR
ncbi:hypothetical protein EVAR_25220_1 [Eumeta japonica]|uniref:Uncharacterized protein n=1 Tax=Eumeta variegata TaxID=151549 RepID=A0A4C1WHI0_EUMVA|nr:hypothetical protein EVAR_25220_1 [Eumeta japonica]